MGTIHHLPPLTEAAFRALRDVMLERHVKRGPLGEWDVPAVARYIFDRLRQGGWTVARIKDGE